MTGPPFASARPVLSEFKEAAAAATVVPLVRTLMADWWTPVQVFHLLSGDGANSFLLESVEQGERIGRYSFLGRRPYLVARARGDTLRLEGREAHRQRSLAGSPLVRLKQLLGEYRSLPRPELPPFASGAVGYFGYDTVRWLERLPENPGPPCPEDDMTLLFLEEIVSFDHVARRMHLIVNLRVTPGVDLDALHAEGVRRLDAMESQLRVPFTPGATEGRGGPPPETRSNTSREEYMARVEAAKEHILAGDVFQVVLSQRFSMANPADDLSLYRALRSVNPSPYMFLLRLEDWSMVGSSPEPLLRVQGDRLQVRPIAGTVARSPDVEEDDRRARRLVEDPKERAEHVMLVDLGRNDLGRCAAAGTVRVNELLTVERYSHVMHLVSGLSATLRPDLDPLDALYACFPAGTVSGAPKIRAMELIQKLEPDRRGVYAGAVGYLDFSGNLDTCIALRTMVVRRDEIVVQAGAGIVADSDPAREYEETRRKAAALIEAVGIASGMGGNPR